MKILDTIKEHKDTIKTAGRFAVKNALAFTSGCVVGDMVMEHCMTMPSGPRKVMGIVTTVVTTAALGNAIDNGLDLLLDNADEGLQRDYDQAVEIMEGLNDILKKQVDDNEAAF